MIQYSRRFDRRKGIKIMEKLTDNLKKILLAGIGTVAVTAEKSKDILDRW